MNDLLRIKKTPSFLLALAALLVTACGASSLCAEDAQESNAEIAKLFQGDDLVDADRLQSVLERVARERDFDAAERMLNDARSAPGRVGDKIDQIALLFYDVFLTDAVEGRRSFEDFEARLRDDADRYADAARVAFQMCRVYGFYEGERADKLYYDLVGNFAASDSDDLKTVASNYMQFPIRPYAASDASFGKFLDAPTPENHAQALALEARVKRANEAHREIRKHRADYPLESSTLQLALNKLREAKYDDFNFETASYQSLQTYILSIQSFQELERAQSELSKTANSNYEPLTSLVKSRYFQLKGDETLLKGSDAQIALAREFVDALKTDPTLTRLLGDFYWRTLVRMGEDARRAFRDALIDAGFVDLVPQFDGAVKMSNIVGQKVVVEGVCDDGSLLTEEDTKGKTLLVVIVNNASPEIQNAHQLLPDDFLVVALDWTDPDMQRSPLPPFIRKRISRTRTLAENEFSGKKFSDFAEWTGAPTFLQFPVSFLVNPEGVVVATFPPGANGLTDELRKIYPNVFNDAQQPSVPK